MSYTDILYDSKQRVLIVDDNPDDLVLFCILLEKEGYILETAENGEEALARIDMEPPDLVLMDIQMPLIDGYTACKLIKQNPLNKDLPVIFISGMRGGYNKKMAYDAGGVDYIEKPFQNEEFVSRIKTHIKLYSYRKALEESNLKLLKMFRTAFEQVVVGMVHVEPKSGKIIKSNKRFRSIFGFPDEESTKLFLFDLPLQGYKDKVRKGLEMLSSCRESSYNTDFVSTNMEGDTIWIKMGLAVIRNPGGDADFIAGVIEDITKQKEDEALLIHKQETIAQSLEEKEVLIKELYHRTKNNMQVIASMISLKAEEFADPKIYGSFKDLEGRIYSMALVHKLLYKSQNLSHINLMEYVHELFHLNRRGNSINQKIKFQIEVQNIEVIIDTAIPIGLVLNELISNSLKYAFGEGEGRIVCRIYSDNNSLFIEYNDNGKGMTKEFSWENVETLGLLTVKSLVLQQLKGSIQLDSSSRGVSFKITCMPDMYLPRV